MADSVRSECIQETLRDLREDTALLRLTVLGTRGHMDRLTRDCLIRLIDYLGQHVNDICVLCRDRSRRIT